MSIYKRQGVYWFNFWHENEHYQRSTRQTNQRIARRMEAAFRTRLMQEGVGIVQRKPSPVFADFAKRFIEHVQVRHESKPQTVSFYAAKLNRLMAYAPLASAELDKIVEALIEATSSNAGSGFHPLPSIAN